SYTKLTTISYSHNNLAKYFSYPVYNFAIFSVKTLNLPPKSQLLKLFKNVILTENNVSKKDFAAKDCSLQGL
ncbi:MAG: hypothetical protein IJB87_07070, partial [Alistipes sp.]|nr:hypothetical protein [Alistipes sp.]